MPTCIPWKHCWRLRTHSQMQGCATWPRIIERVADIAAASGYRLPEHYDAGWAPLPEYNAARPDDPFRPYGVTPGHGFEWSRLTMQWTTQAERLPEFLPHARKLFVRAAADGWAPDACSGRWRKQSAQQLPFAK